MLSSARLNLISTDNTNIYGYKGGLFSSLKRWQRRSLSLRLVDDLWGWGGRRVVVKTCWCRWSMRLRREARAPLSKRLETLNELELEDEEEHFLNTFSFLANVSTYAAHLCTPASGKYFLFEFIYLFVPVTPGRSHPHRRRSVLLTFLSQKTCSFRKGKKRTSLLKNHAT